MEKLKEEIKNLKGQDGITLSGGDPLFQIEACNEIAKYCKEQNLNVWCYTGLTFEELLKMKEKNKNLEELLNNIDILKDGKFIESKKSLNLPFRGSLNQRILDLKQSLKNNKPVEIEKYKSLPNVGQNTFGRTDNMYI